MGSNQISRARLMVSINMAENRCNRHGPAWPAVARKVASTRPLDLLCGSCQKRYTSGPAQKSWPRGRPTLFRGVKIRSLKEEGGKGGH